MATEYVVCARVNDRMEVLGTAEANTGEGAAKKVFGDKGGRFVAVPMRHWIEGDLGWEQPPPIARVEWVAPQFPGQMALADPAVATPEEDGA